MKSKAKLAENYDYVVYLTENLLFWRLEKEPIKFSFVALLKPNVRPPGSNVVLNMDTLEANMALNMDTPIPNMALPKRYTKEKLRGKTIAYSRGNRFKDKARHKVCEELFPKGFSTVNNDTASTFRI